mmetsp:Transcript_1049/g.3195  ORF Transcript_1049/g.3195 Transcript_1049/m.3195 type:complete len:331 (-) Transcript_1049:1344-2336(-)
MRCGLLQLALQGGAALLQGGQGLLVLLQCRRCIRQSRRCLLRLFGVGGGGLLQGGFGGGAVSLRRLYGALQLVHVRLLGRQVLLRLLEGGLQLQHTRLGDLQGVLPVCRQPGRLLKQLLTLLGGSLGTSKGSSQGGAVFVGSAASAGCLRPRDHQSLLQPLPLPLPLLVCCESISISFGTGRLHRLPSLLRSRPRHGELLLCSFQRLLPGHHLRIGFLQLRLQLLRCLLRRCQAGSLALRRLRRLRCRGGLTLHIPLPLLLLCPLLLLLLCLLLLRLLLSTGGFRQLRLRICGLLPGGGRILQGGSGCLFSSGKTRPQVISIRACLWCDI